MHCRRLAQTHRDCRDRFRCLSVGNGTWTNWHAAGQGKPTLFAAPTTMTAKRPCSSWVAEGDTNGSAGRSMNRLYKAIHQCDMYTGNARLEVCGKDNDVR